MSTPRRSDDDQLQACEEYCRTHNVQKLIKDAIVQLCIKRPEKPISFLKDYFAQLESKNGGVSDLFPVLFFIYQFLWLVPTFGFGLYYYQ